MHTLLFARFTLAIACLISTSVSQEEDDYPRGVIASVLTAAREERGLVNDLEEVQLPVNGASRHSFFGTA